MNDKDFVDYYELLQLNPNADAETIERIFRHLAKKYHPDNNEFSDAVRFHKIVEAHKTLSDPELRAGYDAKYQEYWNRRWGLAAEASKSSAFGEDKAARDRLLSLLYIQRRRSMMRPGLGEYDLARLLNSPLELLEFHLWYLKSKGWVERTEGGQLAITVAGVDQVEQSKILLGPDHLLEAPRPKEQESGEGAGAGDEQLLVRCDEG